MAVKSFGFVSPSIRLINIHIPRNGIATGGSIDGGNILSTKMSIGGPDSRMGVLNGAVNSLFGTPFGIAGHGKFNKGNTFATRLNFCLESHNTSLCPELSKRIHQHGLAVGNGIYKVDAIKAHFKTRYAAFKAANLQSYFNPPSAAVVMGAYCFVSGVFSNGHH